MTLCIDTVVNNKLRNPNGSKTGIPITSHKLNQNISQVTKTLQSIDVTVGKSSVTASA